MKHIKTISIAVCAAVLLTLTGCTLKAPQTVMTVDGKDISAGLYLTYQMQAYNDAYSKAEDSTNVLGGEIEGVKAEDWVHAETVKAIQKYAYIAKAYDEAGLSMTDDELATLKDTVDSAYTSNQSWFEKNGIGHDSYYEYCLSAEKENALYNKYDETNKPSESDVKAYMEENYSHVKMLYLPRTDANYAPVDNDALAEIKTEGQKMADAINGGDDFDDVAEDTLKTVFGITGAEFTDTTTTSYSTETFIEKDSTSYEEDMLAQLFEAKTGTAFVYESDSMLMVINKLKNFETDDDFASYKDSVSSEMTYADFEAETDEAAANVAYTENASAVKTYSPKKIVVE